MSRIWQIRNRLLIYRVSFLFDKLGRSRRCERFAYRKAIRLPERGARIRSAVAKWRDVAVRLGILRREQEEMAVCFTRWQFCRSTVLVKGIVINMKIVPWFAMSNLISYISFNPTFHVQ